MCRLPGFLSLILSQDFTVSHCECVTERAGFHESCRNPQLNLTCIDTRQLSSSSLASAGFFQQRLIVLQRRVCACSCWALGPLRGLLRNESRQSISNKTPDLSAASETYGVTHTHTETGTNTVQIRTSVFQPPELLYKLSQQWKIVNMIVECINNSLIIVEAPTVANLSLLSVLQTLAALTGRHQSQTVTFKYYTSMKFNSK